MSPPSPEDLEHLTAIGIDAAREAGLTGAGILVGILDDAVDADHPEFADRIVETYNLVTGTSVDFTPLSPHGTHVLGSFAGQNVGVAPGVDILSGALFAPGLDGFEEGVEENVLIPNAIRWAVDSGARVINNSWGFDIEVTDARPRQYLRFFPGLIDSFQHAAEAGVVMVWANGNTALENPTIDSASPFHFPELQPTWITVAALGPDGNIAPYSNRCGVAADFCITAPGGGLGEGEGILSSVDGGGYETFSAFFGGPWAGTSMAAPQVSGAVAIGMEMFPDAAPEDITQFVLRTAIDIGEEGVDDIYGWGFLSLGNMVAATSSATASVHANAAWSRLSALDITGAALRQQVGGLNFGTTDTESVAVSQADGAGAAIDSPFWVTPLAGGARIDAGPTSAAASSRSFGVLAGADLYREGPWQLGAGIGYTRSTLDESGRPDTADTDALHAVAYARYDDGPWFATLTGQIATFRQDLERHSIAGTASTSAPPVATAQLDGVAFSGDLKFGREVFATDRRSVAAFVATEAAMQRTNGFTEQDAGVFALSADRSAIAQYAAGIGVQWSEEIRQAAGTPLEFVTDIAVMHRFGELDHDTTLSMLGLPITAATVGMSETMVRMSGAIVTPTREGAARFGYEVAYQESGLTLAVGLNVTF